MSDFYPLHVLVSSLLQIRNTRTLSVWPVAFTAKLYYEGPLCAKGRVSAWHTAFAKERPFPIDMAGFATNLKLLLDNPGVVFTRSQIGYMESNFLKQFPVSVEEVECKGNGSMEVCVGRGAGV